MPQYQGVWTLEAQAQALTKQQWVTDPNFKNTTLLLQADGTGSGSQNQSFLDSSTNNFYIARNGNTTQGSFSPFSQAPGYWGNYFDGTGDYLTIASNAALQITNVDWTVESWMYLTTLPSSGGYQAIAQKGRAATTNFEYLIAINNNAGNYRIAIELSANGSTVSAYNSSNITLTANSWNHFAVSKSGTTLYYFVNGVAAGTSTITSATGWHTGTGDLGIGANNTGSFPVFGYMSNTRITKSGALYTTAFTPSTVPLTTTVSAGTVSLLTCLSNRFIDTSSNAFTITPNGNVSVQAFGPFAPALQWTPDVVGGSGYFDGSSDYLTLPVGSSWLFTGDHCLEAWVYWTTSTAMVIYATGGASSTDQFLLSPPSEGIWWGTTSLSSSVFPQVNAWNHVCVTRQGSTIRRFLNGQLITTGTNASNIGSSTATPYIGARSGSSLYWNGYLSQLRIVNGSVPTTYQTSSTTINAQIFTPPTAPLTTSSQGATSGDVKLLFSATNAGIYDGKMANNLETVGNAQVATSPVKYGSGSMYFDGTGDYLVARSSPLFALGTADFTVEFWIWINALPATSAYTTYFSTRTGGTGMDIQLFNNAGTYQFMVGNPTGAIISANNVLSTSTWTHIAATRQNGFFRLFVNGIVVASGASSQNFTDTGCYVACGISGGNQTNCYIDDLRVTNGVSRYNANFTPPQVALPRQ